MSESHGLGTLGAEPPLQLSCSFTLSLLDEAAHVLVTLRASFADRTLAWVSSWGRKKLISAPFLFYPQRFFEVGQSQGFSSRGAGKLSSLGKTSMPGLMPHSGARRPTPGNPGSTSRGGPGHLHY